MVIANPLLILLYPYYSDDRVYTERCIRLDWMIPIGLNTRVLTRQNEPFLKG